MKLVVVISIINYHGLNEGLAVEIEDDGIKKCERYESTPIWLDNPIGYDSSQSGKDKEWLNNFWVSGLYESGM